MLDSVQTLLSSGVLSKNINIKVYRSTVLPVMLYGVATRLLVLREGHRQRMWNRVLDLRGMR
jgi:hypothetical protein